MRLAPGEGQRERVRCHGSEMMPAGHRGSLERESEVHRRTSRFVAAGAIACGSLLALASGVRAQEEVTLKVAHFLPAAAPAHALFMEPWARKVEEESGGRIKVEIYPAMQLGGKAPQLYDQVRDGIA